MLLSRHLAQRKYDLSPFSAIDPCGYKGLEVRQLKDFGVVLPQAEVESKLLKYLTKSLNY